MHSAESILKLTDALSPLGVCLSATPNNLVEAVWRAAGDVTPPPLSPLRVQPLELTGASATHKIAKIREYLQGLSRCRSPGSHRGGGDRQRGLVLSQLDDIAWMLNIRGGDVPCSQVAIAYAIVTEGRCEESLYALLHRTKLRRTN